MALLLFLSGFAAADLFEEWDDLPADELGDSYGVAVGDVDGDGWTDVVNPQSHVLWRNDAARGWTAVELPQLELADERDLQYGASLGDYDADGLPDLATEPRGDKGRLLHNEGGGEFVALDSDHFHPVSDDQFAETNGWIDADGDGLLDLFVPAYYGESGFYRNLGPDATGVFSFEEMALDIGMTLSETRDLRPEGAQFADVDRDGDPDLYVCSELLRNVSTPGDPWFVTDNGGLPADGFDEGAAFADIDMDGDLDLGVLYYETAWKGFHGSPFLLWENLGDGTFAMLDPETVEDHSAYGFGVSFADWDNDGDPDLSIPGRFEENRWREDGVRAFVKINERASLAALAAWFDWDFDGDLDVAGGWYGQRSTFFTSSLYDAVAEHDREFLRVRPVADSMLVARGVDTEFGATVDVRVVGEAPEVRRRSFTASGHGYLNQSEYALTFGLEGVHDPVVDVSVDFANPGDDGLWRVDKYVNPALGGIDVDALALPREVRVFRSGDVEIGGKRYPANADEFPLLETPGGLSAPSIDDQLAFLDAGTWVGLEVSIPADEDDARAAAIREVVVDAVLDAPVTCGSTTGNVLLWDVTEQPELVAAARGPILADNRRVDVPTDFELRNGRTYRVLARVREARTYVAPKSGSWLSVTGAVAFVPPSPCDASDVAEPIAEPGARSMAVRWRETVHRSGEADDTAAGDSGTTNDDSESSHDSTPAEGGNGRHADDRSAGCGCASSHSASSTLAILLALVAWRRPPTARDVIPERR